MDFIKFVRIVILCSSLCESSKILVTPVDAGYNSRLKNMIQIGKLLMNAGHEVTLLFSDQLEVDALYKLAETNTMNKTFNVIHYKKPPVDPSKDMDTLNQDWLKGMMKKNGVDALEYISSVFDVIISYPLEDDIVWKRISTANFDLIVSDENVYYSRIVAASFDVPLILYSNWGPMTFGANLVQRFNLALVPAFVEPYSDALSFSERVYNVWQYYKLLRVNENIFSKSIGLCRQHGYGEACDNIKDAEKTVSLIFMNRNDVLHYPLPLMPHVISLEGFFLETPKSLGHQYKDIIERAGKNGIIVVSFGSMFRKLWPELRTIFAKAFAAMPQTVIWSYEGPTPEGIGKNTYVSKWIPQESLLNHPATKVFVTQCGASSSFQALHYAVPVVGVPFFWDQPYYCQKLTERVKAGQTVHLEGITSEKLKRAMEEVIKNKTYKENAAKAAAIYHDQPIPPKDKVVYWAEYVIRHKGAPHLRSQGANALNFFQYFLLDITALVAAIIVAMAIILIIIVKKSISIFSRNFKKNKRD
ncbi:unnamed protein product [Owenia fusiformis]|uniref:UDP-glucuronosyltransferase n=1 Tax=Owenia fusiformis TaxID=6347 RepID=A0A8S4MXE1_OWEFU|nr:unnamed protein product [Owenia fusiformis]